MLTFGASRQTEGCESSDDAEHIVRQYRRDFPLRRIRTMKRQPGAAGSHNLLLLSASELAQYSLTYGAGRLDG